MSPPALSGRPRTRARYSFCTVLFWNWREKWRWADPCLAKSNTPLVSLSSRWTTRTRGSPVPEEGNPSWRPIRSSTLSVSARPGIVASPAGFITATQSPVSARMSIVSLRAMREF